MTQVILAGLSLFVSSDLENNMFCFVVDFFEFRVFNLFVQILKQIIGSF